MVQKLFSAAILVLLLFAAFVITVLACKISTMPELKFLSDNAITFGIGYCQICVGVFQWVIYVRQTEILTSQEKSSRSRERAYVQYFKKSDESDEKNIKLCFKNYGTLPAMKVQERFTREVFKVDENTIQEFITKKIEPEISNKNRKLKNNTSFSLPPIGPKETMNIKFDLNIKDTDKTSKNDAFLFGYCITYNDISDPKSEQFEEFIWFFIHKNNDQKPLFTLVDLQSYAPEKKNRTNK